MSWAATGAELMARSGEESGPRGCALGAAAPGWRRAEDVLQLVRFPLMADSELRVRTPGPREGTPEGGLGRGPREGPKSPALNPRETHVPGRDVPPWAAALRRAAQRG